MNDFEFCNFLTTTFFLPLISNIYDDLNGSLTYDKILSISVC